MTIVGLHRKLKALDTDKVAIEAVTTTKENIKELNIEQINSGLRSDGSEILPSYTDFTIQIKKLKGQETRFVNLLDTGDFYKAIKTNVTGAVIQTDSSDNKTAKLKKKYETSKGKLFRLNKDSRIEYVGKTLRPEFKKRMTAATGLKFN